MTATPTDDSSAETTPSRPLPPDLVSWLNSPLPENALSELPVLHKQLRFLRAHPLPPQQQANILESIYERTIRAAASLRPLLLETVVPPPKKTRQLIRGMQDALNLLAGCQLGQIDLLEDGEVSRQELPVGRILWRTLDALSQHLLIGALSASPSAHGVWLELHRAYETARRLGATRARPEGESNTIRDVYYAAILFGCAQPASFTSPEIDFLHTYIERFSRHIDPGRSRDTPPDGPSVFWIDPTRDAPATPFARRPPPPGTPVRRFSCARLEQLLETQLAGLDRDSPPDQLNLPDFAATPAGRGVLRRLIAHWGRPGKRRFPRRRQNYRAQMCSGLDKLWHLFSNEKSEEIEPSHWMITNESPDGYSAMHASGKTGDIVVGDIVALRTETGDGWQVCIVRWILSENQEHLELGCQILSPRANAAVLALPDTGRGRRRLPVLVLPIIPTLRRQEMLVTPSGIMPQDPKDLVLVIEKNNVEVRELGALHLDEQNSQVEIFSIEPSSYDGN